MSGGGAIPLVRSISTSLPSIHDSHGEWRDIGWTRTVVHQERHVRVDEQVVGLFGSRIRGHDNDGHRRVRRRRQVGVVHQRHMRLVIDARGEMKLSRDRRLARAATIREGNEAADQPTSRPGLARARSYESSIFQTLYDLKRKLADGLLMCVAGRSLVVQRYLFHSAAL